MREKIFRGKWDCNGQWLFGGFHSRFGRAFIIGASKSLRFDGFEVIPETIGQYIGLRDCKRTNEYPEGQMIFEGDIVKFGDIIGIINYNIGCYCVKTNKPDWKSRNNPAIDIVINEYPNEIVVIGNIHDNPELVKETKE